jgi:hypothetical protein
MAGALLAPAGAWAALPPSNVQAAPIGNAAASKLVEDARRALKGGNLRLALINLKNAVTADPTTASCRLCFKSCCRAAKARCC